MQAIMETLFDIVYLTTVITLGVIMITRSKGTERIGCLGSWLSSWTGRFFSSCSAHDRVMYNRAGSIYHSTGDR